jgi:hypothetical protein
MRLSKRSRGEPEVVYATSREEAQRLLDESYLDKYVAVPVAEWQAICDACARATAKQSSPASSSSGGAALSGEQPGQGDE